jgi:Kelch motif
MREVTMQYTVRHRWLGLVALGLAACEDNRSPTEPDLIPAEVAVAAAGAGSWSSRAPTFYDQFIFGYDLATAPDASGKSIVYAFGGVSSDDGFVGAPITAYDVAADAWSRRTSSVHVSHSNGVVKLGNKLYFSGGRIEGGSLPDYSRQLWAYDYTQDRMIRKADLPIFSAEGVSGVIDGRLYVLPGACNGNGWPSPGYCLEEPTRRFYRYDPGTNTWISRRQAPNYHRGGAAAVLGGKLYVAGGFGPGSAGVAALDVYDPKTNAWRTLASLPTGGRAQGVPLGGQFHVLVGGQHYAYSPVTGKWTTRAAPAEPIGAATKVTLNGSARIFAAQGDNGTALFTP